MALDRYLDEVCASHVHMHERGFRPLKAKLGHKSRVDANGLGCACRTGRLGHRRYRLSFWQNIPLDFIRYWSAVKRKEYLILTLLLLKCFQTHAIGLKRTANVLTASGERHTTPRIRP